nr:13531_t:CDS:2 [Entrophospora candida]
MTRFNNNQSIMIDKSSLPTTITNNTVNTYIDTNIETNNSSNFHITNINTLSEMLITQSDTSSASLISLNENTNTTGTTNTTNTSATNITSTTTIDTSAKKKNYNGKFYKRIFFQQFSQNNKSTPPKKINKTRLILLSETSDEYKGLKEKFQYERPLKNSGVRYILKLEMPSKLTKSHERYKKIVARLNNLSVDEVTRSAFHGTFSAYNPLCESGCGMCGIIRQGNKTKCSKHKSLFSSRKMWFATDPNTSLYFCTSNNSLKTMFVVDVISKKPKHIYVTNKEKATLPRYLILFEYKHQDVYA